MPETPATPVTAFPRSSYAVTPKGPAVFKVTQTFPPSKPKPTLNTYGALLDKDQLMASEHVRVLQKFEWPRLVWVRLGLTQQRLLYL